jgi:hypothetical protein
LEDIDVAVSLRDISRRGGRGESSSRPCAGTGYGGGEVPDITGRDGSEIRDPTVRRAGSLRLLSYGTLVPETR